MLPGRWFPWFCLLFVFPAWANEANPGELTRQLAHTGQCPPFCMTPMRIHPNVRVLGELELNKLVNARGAVLVDVRGRAETRHTGSIENAVLLPFYDVGLEFGADPERHTEAINWLFSRPRLVVFDDGPHDYRAIRVLLELLKEGMPGERLFWYRGGLLHWRQSGLPIAPIEDFHAAGKAE